MEKYASNAMLSELADTICILYSATDFLYNHKQATCTSCLTIIQQQPPIAWNEKDSALFLCTMSWACSEHVLWLTDKKIIFFAYTTGSATTERISDTEA